MPLISFKSGLDEKILEIHEGSLEDARSILTEKEYDVERIWFAHVENVIDVGAHIGLFAIFIKSKYPYANLYCFEPLKVNFALLQSNTFDLDSIHIKNYGLSSYEHSARIWLSPAFGHGAASTHRTYDHSDEGEDAKFVVAANELALIDGPISILKIDTEGHELRILRNIVPELGRIRSIFLEVHSSLALANILLLLNGKFVPFHFGSGMGNRYKVMLVNLAALSEGIVNVSIAPEIYYD